MLPAQLKHWNRIRPVVSVLIIVVLIAVALVVLSNRTPQSTSSKASNTVNTQIVKDELQTKSLGSLCTENGGRVISPFEQCEKRVSEDKENPLYYCCQ